MIGLCIFIGVAVVALGAVVASAFSQGAASTSAGGQAQATATNAKDKKSREDKTLIGLKSATLNPTTPGLPYALTNSFDATSFVDKCTLSFTNAGGVSTYLNDFSIRGLPIYRYAGNNGYKFEHINHSDVEANGEMAYKVSNNYITSAAQCEDVGDYVRKELEPHDMYSVTLNGVHPYYQIGDRYELNIDYQLASMPFPTELISVDVEIRGVMINRRCDNIGQTVLSCRVPSGAWNKTTSTKAKWISSGLPLDKLNRSNELTIGAYDYPGQADRYCDGVADDVQIQEAIDLLFSLGGGDIKLTRGHFKVSSIITLRDGVNITGDGKNTKICPQNIARTLVFASTSAEATLSNFTISGADVTYTNRSLTVISEVGSTPKLVASGITIADFTFVATATSYAFFGMVGIKIASGCIVENISLTVTTGTGIDMYGFSGVETASQCIIRDIDAVNSEGTIRGFYGGNNISGCIFHDCTLGVGSIIAYAYCGNITSSSMRECDGYNTYCAVSCSNMSCVSSYSNLASATYYGFYSCNNITVCSSLSNTGTSAEIGFINCKSVQQCKTDDATKYSNSYADAGTSNACADTSAGGYNS